MPTLALGLVLVAALVHATWNLLAKAADEPLPFLWCSTVVAAIVFLPVGMWGLLHASMPSLGWAIVGASVLLEAAYYWALSQAYRYGDLSLVYPIARGTAPLLVPVLAAALLGERLSPVALVGVGLVVAGALLLHLRTFGLAGLRVLAGSARGAGTRYALLTGAIIATYSTLDKRGVTYWPAPLYGYALFVGLTVALVPLLRGQRAVVAREWRRHRRAILAVGVLAPVAYGLVLLALTLAPVSSVAAARESSAVMAAVLGALVLREPYGRQRLVGSTVIVSGLALLVTG